ncbi:MAG: molybdate ABC transporter substrate-binding protein [Alphaproteobacteria bacterium]|nr:molybdate ABC transporter substrate-binding protein [Alphaproteobacteria bacterium]
MGIWTKWGAALAAAALLAFTPATATNDKLTVYAAASLKESMDELGKAYEAKTGVAIVSSLAASSALARQIENGAEADVFISADTEWMDYLADRGLIVPETRANVVGNHLVLIAPKGAAPALKITPNFALVAALNGGRLSVGDPDAVPAGKYARQSLTTLGVWGQVADHLLRADNVRVALAYVSLGEAPLGIVYATDAMAEPKVEVVDTFPDDTHLPIVYPAAAVKGGAPGAATFVGWLQTPEAGAIFARRGFTVLGAPQ